MICQGEMDPFWGKGHLPNLRAQTSGECVEYELLQKSPSFEEIIQELMNGLGSDEGPRPSSTPTSMGGILLKLTRYGSTLLI